MQLFVYMQQVLGKCPCTILSAYEALIGQMKKNALRDTTYCKGTLKISFIFGPTFAFWSQAVIYYMISWLIKLQHITINCNKIFKAALKKS